jgi:hypothetical protein
MAKIRVSVKVGASWLIDKVFVNGELAVEEGAYLKDKKYGSVLRAC